MPSMRDIRRRIKSVTNTAQITKAMQMVAAAKMKRSQQAAINGRPYAIILHNMLTTIHNQIGNEVQENPLCVKRPIKNEAVILVTTDKGLCGGLNTNLLREAAKFDSQKTLFLAAGRKGSQFVHRTGRNLVASFTFHDTPQYSEARAIVKMAISLFLEAKADRVSVVYPGFKNTMTQIPLCMPILPISELKPIQSASFNSNVADEKSDNSVMIFEPSAKALFDSLLPHYMNTIVYHILLETKACEFSARMVSMKNATDNANTLIKELTVHYNKLRQTGITNQLLEIASATSAFN